MSLPAIALSDLALRASVRRGAWLALIVPEAREAELSNELLDELRALGATRETIDARGGELAIVHALSNAPSTVLVIVGLTDLSEEAWRHLDKLRSALLRDEGCVVLLLPESALKRAMRSAPNLMSLLTAAWEIDEKAGTLSDKDRELRLTELRRAYGLSDEELIAEVEQRSIHLDPEHAEWLVLIGRGDLLDHA